MDRCSLSPAEDFYATKGLTRKFKMDQSHISRSLSSRRNGTDFHLPNCEEVNAVSYLKRRMENDTNFFGVLIFLSLLYISLGNTNLMLHCLDGYYLFMKHWP